MGGDRTARPFGSGSGSGGGSGAPLARPSSSSSSSAILLLVALAVASLPRFFDVSLTVVPHSLRRTNRTTNFAASPPRGARNASLPSGWRPPRTNGTTVTGDDDAAGGVVPPRRRRRRAWIVLVENRDLETSRPYGYYTLAMWSLHASIVTDTEVLVYNSSSLCENGGGPGPPGAAKGGYGCEGYDGIRVSPYWMKVLAVLHAMEDEEAVGEDDLVVFMDTDMQILNANFARSMLELEEVREFLASGRSVLVIEENKDSFWKDHLLREGAAYRSPVVSNAFAVVNDDVGRRAMRTWWQSAGRPTKLDPSGTKYLSEWPWEQERLAAYYDASPELFFAVNQSWTYMGWMHHGPLCCVGFYAKHDIVRSLNETLMNNTRALGLWNGSSYEELADELYGRIDVRPLGGEVGQSSPVLAGFWNGTNATTRDGT